MAEYSEYKDSGIPWIGKIPSHWDVKPIRSFLSQSKELNENENATLLTLSQYKGVNIRNGNEDSAISAAESLVGYNVVHKGQFVMNIMLAWNGSYGVSDYDGVISPAYAIFYFKNDVCKAYYHYLWRTKAYQDAFKTRSKGIVDSRLRLYPQYFLPFYTSIPPKEEQEAIVAYLDKVTADIDKAIAAKERIIASLEERRKIIITHAVTRGINPDAPLKDSGIDRFGQIPVHWETRKVKAIASVSHGSDPKMQGDIPVYGSGAESFRTCGEYKDGPAVLLGRKGATLHIPHYIDGKYWNVDTAFNVKVNNDKFNLRYFYYLAMCFDYERYKTQTTLPSMTQSAYKNIGVPMPELVEQKHIVEYLDKKSHSIDQVVSLQKKLIELLRERKNIIINETVTGKVKVI
ncbi:restriction endonuclease subunit S [Muribaculum intestinale]|uniref:restriction endonuclease subunit S n=1 Tax=Muribaculum intestinale TaxID=1796646 RepID=UPI0025A9D001|nr:restriction endonuclease subunit S [Muribaculum intestinale]